MRLSLLCQFANFFTLKRCLIFRADQHSWNSPPPHLLSFQKLRHLGTVQKCLLERRDKLEREGLMQKWRDCHFFFFTLQFNHNYCVDAESKVPFNTFRIFSLLSQSCKIFFQVFIVLKPCTIFTFLIHSGSLQQQLC